ncbi:MAG: hypothetical protein GX418_12265 [Clostridiales bacterium]|nr:hypothetical protein [Clostridiales bacterium]
MKINYDVPRAFMHGARRDCLYGVSRVCSHSACAGKAKPKNKGIPHGSRLNPVVRACWLGRLP